MRILNCLGIKRSSWWSIAALVIVAMAINPAIAGVAANPAANKVFIEASAVNTGPPGAVNAVNTNAAPVLENALAISLDVGNNVASNANFAGNNGTTVVNSANNAAVNANDLTNPGTSAVVVNPNAGNSTQNDLTNTFISPENIGVNAVNNAANPNANPVAIDTGQANGAAQINNAGNPVARNVTHQAKKI